MNAPFLLILCISLGGCAITEDLSKTSETAVIEGKGIGTSHTCWVTHPTDLNKNSSHVTIDAGEATWSIVCGYSSHFMSETSVYRRAGVTFTAQTGHKYKIKKQGKDEPISIVDAKTRETVARSSTKPIGGCRVSGYYLYCPN
jgi:hypothetical protein